MGPLARPIRRPSEHLLQHLARPPGLFGVIEKVDVFDQQGDLIRLARERAVMSGNGASRAPTPEPWVIEAVTGGTAQIDESRIFLPLVGRSGRRLGALTLLAGTGRSYDEDDLGWAQALVGLLGAAIEKAHLHEEVEAHASSRIWARESSWSIRRGLSAPGIRLPRRSQV